jgi:hypothetical protein
MSGDQSSAAHDKHHHIPESETFNDDIDTISSTEANEIHSEDTEFTNAPWMYKFIALITALFLSCNVCIEKKSVYQFTKIYVVGSHFSGSALSAMKAQIKSVKFYLVCCPGVHFF